MEPSTNITNAMRAIEALQALGIRDAAIEKFLIDDSKALPAEIVQTALQNLQSSAKPAPLSSWQIVPHELNDLPAEILQKITGYSPPIKLGQVSQNLRDHSIETLKQFNKQIYQGFKEEKYNPTPALRELEEKAPNLDSNDPATVKKIFSTLFSSQEELIENNPGAKEALEQTKLTTGKLENSTSAELIEIYALRDSFNTIENKRKMFMKAAEEASIPFVPDLTKPNQHFAIDDWSKWNSKKLKRISHLNLEGLGLTSLPPEIKIFSNMRTLNINNNQLMRLPAEIGELKKLRRLFAEKNKLSAYPTAVNALKELTHLTLSHNQLTAIDLGEYNLPKLHQLDVVGNKLISLPPGITQLWNLSYLYLWDNPLDTALLKDTIQQAEQEGTITDRAYQFLRKTLENLLEKEK